jgi:hypothetical protein
MTVAVLRVFRARNGDAERMSTSNCTREAGPLCAIGSSCRGPPPTRLDGVHVLVVDDNADALEIMQAFLTHGGAVVTTARNGAEALGALREIKTHVIVSDLRRPRSRCRLSTHGNIAARRCAGAFDCSCRSQSIRRRSPTPSPAWRAARHHEGQRDAASSPTRHALRVHVERVERLARGHEDAIALEPAEAEVGAALG